MNVFQFMNDHPFISLFMVWAFCDCIFKVWNRFMRHLNIRAQGWPPAHLDADGDLNDEDDSENAGGHPPGATE